MQAIILLLILLLGNAAFAQTSLSPLKNVANRLVMCGDTNREEPGFWHKLPAKGENNCWYTKNDSDTVIVFLHGIFSDSRGCWLYISPDGPSKDQFWPEIITYDDRLRHPSVFLAGYYTSLDAGRYDSQQAADEVLRALRENGVFRRSSIIFVTHSTGGIIARYLLAHHTSLFFNKRIGLALYASPSRGSYLATWLRWLADVYGQKLGAQLDSKNPFLGQLDQDFRAVLVNEDLNPSNPHIIGVEEVENHFIVHHSWLPDRLVVVEPDSASLYFGTTKILPRADHFTAVKPYGIGAPSHDAFITFFHRFEFESETHIPTTPSAVIATSPPVQAPAPSIQTEHVIRRRADITLVPVVRAGDNGAMLRPRFDEPGTIRAVRLAKCEGGACGWIHQCPDGGYCPQQYLNPVDYVGNSAFWNGWTNSGDFAVLYFDIDWEKAP